MFSNKITQEINKNKYITIKKILYLSNNFSFFLLLFIATFLTSIPSPAWGFGFSTLPAGIISFVIAIQILIGLDHVYLPAFFQNMKLTSSFFKTIEKYTYYFKKNNKTKFVNNNIETKIFDNYIFNRISAIFVLFCSILMMIPIMLTNWMPSVCVSFISISHLFKNFKLLILCYLVTALVIIGYIYLFYLIYYYGTSYGEQFIDYIKNFLKI